MKTDVHVDELLIGHIRGELEGAERARVEAHLAACADCRASRERFAGLIEELVRTAPPAPPIHWGAYRAELRRRLEGNGGRPGAFWMWLRPASALVAAGLVAVLVVAGLPGGLRGPGSSEQLAQDNAILASQLDMIARLEVVQRLDLLEDFNVIAELDQLPEPSKS